MSNIKIQARRVFDILGIEVTDDEFNKIKTEDDIQLVVDNNIRNTAIGQHYEMNLRMMKCTGDALDITFPPKK